MEFDPTGMMKKVKNARSSFIQTFEPHGTLSKSLSHAAAEESLGARQSPRGDSEPPEPPWGRSAWPIA